MAQKINSRDLLTQADYTAVIKKISVISLALILAPTVSGQHAADVYDAINSKDYERVVRLSRYPECDTIAIDALCTLPYYSNRSYEELLPLYNAAPDNTLVRSYLSQLIDGKEKEIRESLSTMSLEDLTEYTKQYPMREPIVSDYLKKMLGGNISSLSYKELAYLQKTLPQFEAAQVKTEMNSRNEEKRQLMTNCVSRYIIGEKATDKQAKYVLEKIIWTYYLEGSKKSLEAYSEIGMVPDDASIAASQYQRIVHSIFSPKQLQKMLQEEINKYCAEINKARKDYSLIAGKSTFNPMSYKVPPMKLSTSASYDDLWEIGKGRQQFVRAREDMEIGTSVIGWLTSGLVGLALKALGDCMSIDTLAKSEYEARKNYVLKVQDAILDSFSAYAAKVVNGFNNTLNQNEIAYEKSIREQ